MKRMKIPVRLTAVILAALLLTACAPADTAPTAAPTEPQIRETAPAGDEVITFRPAECGILPLPEFVYPYAGMTLRLPQALLDQMESYDVLMLSDEGYTADGALGYGVLSWYALTEEQKNEEFTAFDPDAWLAGLSKIGSVGVYGSEAVPELDTLTGCTSHTELGTSADGAYTYYLSIADGADEALAAALSQAVVTVTDMTPIDRFMGKGAFSEARGDAENVGDFVTTDIYGKPYGSELFAGSKLTLVNVFATWCVPCINEMPELEQLRKDLADQGVNVVTVVLDSVNEGNINSDTLAVARRLCEELDLTLPMLVPDETMMNGRLQGIDSIPESFFVDENGNIVGETYIGARDYKQWKQIVEEELSKLQDAE